MYNEYGRAHNIVATLCNEFIYKLKVFVCSFLRSYSRKRICSFERFSNKYIKKRKIPFHKGINYNKLNDEYDYFIAGSDQVWNPNYYDDMYFNFLKFASNEKRIAYAPSIEISNLSISQEQMFKKYLEGFDKISCREQVGADILSKITGKHIPVVLDPTLLFDASEWEKIECKPKFHNRNRYILLYFLGEITEDYRRYIEKISEEYGFIVINLNDINSPYFSCGPAEFVYILHNAQIVFTDSFHACVFSIIFKRHFMAFDRQDGGESMANRLDNLLNMLNIPNHKFKKDVDVNLIMNFNYENSHQILKQLRKQSVDFLLAALNN